jgi:hypothetical protein
MNKEKVLLDTPTAGVLIGRKFSDIHELKDLFEKHRI